MQFCEDITLPSSSTPNATASPSADLSSSIESLKEEATAVYRVKQGVYASDPQALSLKVLTKKLNINRCSCFCDYHGCTTIIVHVYMYIFSGVNNCGNTATRIGQIGRM